MLLNLKQLFIGAINQLLIILAKIKKNKLKFLYLFLFIILI